MKIPSPRRRPLARLLSLPVVLAAVLSLAACGSDDNPMGPEAAPEPEPSLYEVQIALSHLTVLGTCESATDNAGDFDYTIEIYRRDANDVYVLDKEIKGSFQGYPQQTHSLSRIVKFRVLAGKNYYVGFKATDTDPYPNSDDYVGYAQDVNKAGGQLNYDHLLKIGNGSCGLTLEYTATEIPIL